MWDPARQRPFARQAVLGPADPPPVADLGSVHTTGTQRVGDVGALVWVAEQLDLVRLIDQACAPRVSTGGPTVGEMVLAVAVQRACAPSAKRHLATFLESCLPRVSCLAASAFTGQAFHREAARVSDEQLERAQIEIARAVVRRFELSTDVLAFDTTNFDTHIATTTTGDWARRGHAQSKRSDLRVVGLAALVSETGHVPLLAPHLSRERIGSSGAGVLPGCSGSVARRLGRWAAAQPASESYAGAGGWFVERTTGTGSGCRGLLQLDLAAVEPQRVSMGPRAGGAAGAMKPVGGKLGDVRAARLRAEGGNLNRTLVVVESPELLRGQRRGIAVALRKAREELRQLEQRAAGGRIPRQALEDRVNKALQREHLADFVVATVTERGGKVSLQWHVDATRRRLLERTRLGRRVLCTDRHAWSTGRIIHAFRGQWNIEELFRRAKKGGLVPWGPSHQWADSSLRLHTFATVMGLTLASLARQALGTPNSALSTMKTLAGIAATMVQVQTKGRGRRGTVLLAPTITAEQRKAVRIFELGRWMPALLSSMDRSESNPSVGPVA